MGKTIQEALLPIFDLPAVYKKGGKEAAQEYIRATTANLQIEKAKREENKVNQRNAQQKAAEYARAGANTQGNKASTDASAAAEEARKLYDTYVGSDYHQKALEEAGKVDTKKALLNALSMPFADAPVTKKDLPQDETEQSLRAMKDYYESQEVQAENDAVMKRNLEEIAAMPEEDRNNLNRYIIERAQNRTNRFFAGEMQFDTYNLNPIVKKYGDKKVRELAEALEWSQNADLMQQVESAGAEIGDKHPVLGSAASVAGNVIGTSAGIIGRVQELENRTGQFKTLDPNNIGSAPAAFGGAVRGQVTQNIKGDGNSWLRNLAAIAYQGGMSFADSTARLAASGGSSAISAAMASSGAFSDSVRKYSQNGATPEQAAAMAFVDAGLEYVTEKLPTDKVLELFKGGTKKEVVARVLAQAFLVEPSSEEVNLFSSVAAQAAILGEKSDKNLRIGELIANGASYQEAEAQYQRELWQEAAETYAVSAIAGGMSGIGAAAIGQSRQTRAQNPTAHGGAVDVQTDVQTDVQSAQADSGQLGIDPNTPETLGDINQALQQTGEQEATMAPQVQMETTASAPNNAPAAVETAQTMENVVPQAAETAQAVDNIMPQAAEAASVGQAEGAAVQGQTVQTDTGTVGMQSGDSGDIRKSNAITNSGLRSADADIRAGVQQALQNDPEIGDYSVKHNADTLATAQERTATPERVQAEFGYLMQKNPAAFTPEDVVTGQLVSKALFKAGDADGFAAMEGQLAEAAHRYGEGSQAFAIIGTMKDAADPQTAAKKAAETIMGMKQEQSTYTGKDGRSYQQWQKDISREMTSIGMQIEAVPEGDTNAMIDVITQLARRRKTTAWFGSSENLTGKTLAILKRVSFEDLKKIANTQLAAMPDDFRRRTAGEIAGGLRKQHMLSSIKTILRNLSGNTAAGSMDAISDSTGGRMIDALLSRVTGKRTMGNDMAQIGKYAQGAVDGAVWASLCVELNIPIETDIDASYAAAYDNNRGGKYMGKTFRSTGSPVMRFLYAQQKYMAYALEVTDKIFEGGTNAAVTESLNRLENANLTQEEIGQLADYTANRRTFKDATWTDADGKEHGSALSRKAQQIKKPLGVVGDVVMPFASVPMNVAQMGIDYTAGVAKSVTEIASIIQDARAGKEIDVVRQRQAASDFGRGLTGTGLICLFAAAAAKGVIGVHDDGDKDKKALEQSQGLSGAQINWSAMARALEGGSEEWQDGDVVSSLDFLEPFNTQLYLAYELSREDGFLEMLKAYPKASISSIASSLMDSPMMQGLNDLGELIGGVAAAAESGDIGEGMDALAGYAGSVATSFIPQYVRQTAQYTDGYYRDTRGENTAEYAKNSFLAAIPGASQTLPKKVDGFGNEQERGGFINTFLDPTNTRRLALSDEAGYLEELAGKTGNFGIYPERQAPMRVKNADGAAVELTGQQRETYQKVYGQWAEGYYSSLMGDRDFRKLPEDMQVEALEKAKTYAAEHARAAVTDFAGAKAGSYDQTGKQIIRDVVLSDMGKAIARAKAGKNTGALEDAYKTYSGLTGIGKRDVLAEADKSTQNYIKAMESGVSMDAYMGVLKALDGTSNQGQKIQALKNVGGMTSQQKEDIIKANVSDKQVEVIDEVQEIAEQYDIPGDYLELYAEAYGIVTPKGKKNDKIRKLMDEYGINWSAAAALYGAYK